MTGPPHWRKSAVDHRGIVSKIKGLLIDLKLCYVGKWFSPLATQVTIPYGIVTEVVQQRAGGWFLFNQIWKMNCPADWRVNDQNLRVRLAYSVDPSILDFGGNLCSLCCPLDRTANCVTDKTKFRPTNFILFSGYETPNSTITCTAWTYVRSFRDGCQFCGDSTVVFWKLIINA